MVTIRVDRVARSFGDHIAVDGVDLTIEDGEFFVLLGPSGCGKTTLLRMIAGLEPPTRGDIVVDGVSVAELDTHGRHLGMLFQQSALYPHLTVRDNIGFPLKMAGVRNREVVRAVESLAATVGLEDVLDLRPSRLSGGMRQRTALARAIIRSPSLLLMDEPMSNVDAKLRTHLRAELAMLQRSIGATAVYVTHDQVEAMALADRIAIMYAGRVVQCGAPMELYAHPASAYVASFIGAPPTRLFSARIDEVDGDPVITTAGGQILLGAERRDLVAAGARDVVVGVRPENLRLVGRNEQFGLRAEVVRSVSIGDHHEIAVSLAAPPVTADPLPVIGDAEVTTIMLKASEAHDVDLWRPVSVAVDPEGVLVFDRTTGASLDPAPRFAALG